MRVPTWARHWLVAVVSFLAGASNAVSEPVIPGAPPAIVLANVYAGQVDPADYWVSEKLDGVRALWDGHRLRFRSGESIAAPEWFLAGLPPVPLDGELWMGRGTFDRLSGIVRRERPEDVEWRGIRYMIFELPGAPGSFTDRIARMKAIVASANVSWLASVEQFRVPDRAMLERHLASVVDGGGEGLMLHRADAPALTGRSDTLLKLKPWQDAEAVVVGHVGGRGRLAGMLGALEVETPAGRRFRIGTGFTDALRRDPPPIGAIVTYRYRGLTATGLPRFASYLRRRELP